ncbi:MFS transporter [Roseateles cellulosilyticus]|uniref:MFS transporter n=1 Tax=Pelomonas cellulosilytica TaxID=2906762 RepID=A0ABS8XZA1_9BURK|nr:MFS transporter [Pelomonas sp. P8]MCE4556152.1 MFS transporter [Pelomonas sp. P8]
MGTASSTFQTPQSGPFTTRTDEELAPGDIAVGVIIGRASEYFDFFVFGIASVLVFPQVFFPFEDRLNGTLYSFLIFALAFVVRPVGTLIGMEIQRRFGRSTKLTAALFLLGSSTVAMGLLPSFTTSGNAAIVLLALCRVGQGLALGASWDGLPSLLALNAPPDRRGWYAMLGQLGAPLGFFVASGVFLYVYGSLDAKDFLSWGWRFPFFTAFAINVVALFARLRLVVTHEYEKRMEEHELDPAYLHELLPAQGHHIVIGAFAALASYALFHLVTVFPLSWVALFANGDVADFMKMELLGAAFAAAAMPMSGLIADKVGRRSFLGALAVAIGAFAIFAPFMLGGGKPGQAAFILVGFVLLGLSYGQAAGSVTSNFRPHFRYTGAALTADMAWLLGAAFAPVIVLFLSSRFGLVSVSLYLLSGVVCTLLALRVNKKLRAAAVVQD